MTITTPPDSEVTSELAATPPETILDPSAGGAGGTSRLRHIVVVFPVLAAAMMTGGLFNGIGGRTWAAIAGCLGVALAVYATSIRQHALMYAFVIGGILLIGLVAVVPTGFGNVIDVGSEIRSAITSGDVLRPPVDFAPGWHAILAWVMATVGFASGWLAVELRRPAFGLMASLPVVGLGAISLPESQQLGTGLAALVLFGIGLGLLSAGEADDGETRRIARAYEVRRAIRAIPVMGIVMLALYFGAKSSFLFPEPLYDPAQDAKLPKSIPLDEVTDRVLFTVDAKFNGPWKMGSIDVYDGKDWRLPPFSESALNEVPASGIVDRSLEPGVRATFTIRGLTGAVLPGLPNTVGIVAEGPKLAFDGRSGNIRLSQGQFKPGFQYLVAAARVPSIDKLRKASRDVPDDIKPFLDVPEEPPAVAAILRSAPTSDLWDRLDYVRQRFLHTVSASGAGTPVSVPPERVDDMLRGSKRGSPYEIVAAQALLARWSGVPARIGYGFDGGDVGPGGALEVRPKHGALYLEVYFTGYGWLPVIGDPLMAEESLSDQPQQFNPNVQISEDVAVRLFLPVVSDESTTFFEQARTFGLRIVPIVLFLLLVSFLWPLPYKAVRRARRRAWAAERGPTARIALAYAEWRDHATDFGYRHYTDTPLMFLERTVPDEEHTELAWLVTRTMWGDLRDDVEPDDALAAEELSRSLRRRMAQAQPVTLRSVAALSRLSVKHPYAPGLDVAARKVGSHA